MSQNENTPPTPDTPEFVPEVLSENPAAEEAVPPETLPVEEPLAPVDPVRSAAGRRGGERFHQLVKLGLEYEREHGLKAGRQRLRQLVQLGRRVEQERGLAPKPRKRRGDA